MSILFSVLAGVIPVVGLCLLSRVDEDMTCDVSVKNMIILSVVTTALSSEIMLFHPYDWLTAVIIGLVAFSAYCDAYMSKSYFITNIAIMAVALISYFAVGKRDLVPIVIAVVAYMLGVANVYGRTDGSIIAAVSLYTSIICGSGYIFVDLLCLLVGCIVFIVYGLTKYFIEKRKDKTASLKTRRPLLPSLSAGLLVLIFFV